MQIPKDAMLLRIFIGESDRWKHGPLFEGIVMKARERHLAGATVLRGPMGFGAASRIHTAKILRLSMDLPIVIEIVDSEEKINAFLPDLEERKACDVRLRGSAFLAAAAKCFASPAPRSLGRRCSAERRASR